MSSRDLVQSQLLTHVRKLHRNGLVAYDTNSEEWRSYCDLLAAEWVVLDGAADITWNGFHIILPPGENIVPMPFWVTWRQAQVDEAQGWQDLNRDIEKAMAGKLSARRLVTDKESARQLTPAVRIEMANGSVIEGGKEEGESLRGLTLDHVQFFIGDAPQSGSRE